tara:strand:+ start:1341 stop:1727 length:387 start_codon:yes stop_codon:yes gene_type:complete
MNKHIGIILLISFIILVSVKCCCKKEGMANITPKSSTYAPVNFNISQNNVSKKYDKIYIPGDNYEKVELPLPEGQLTFFANNEFKSECCANNTVSGSNGCPCITTEQKNYLGSRGGNKAFTEWDKQFS